MAPFCGGFRLYVGGGFGDNDCFSVIVRDFGCGITRDHLEHVFEPFFTEGRGKGGTGLGLAVVKNLVTDSLHWEKRITSKLGEGTEVFLILPQVMAHRQALKTMGQ